MPTVYNAEVDRLRNLIHKARLMEFVARGGETPDRGMILEAVKMRKNAQAELASIQPQQFNPIRLTK